MKKISALLFLVILLFCSCDKEEENISLTLKFTHNWNGVPVTNQDFNTFKFTTANGENISIERLRYLISNISLAEESANNHFLIDVGKNAENLIPIKDVLSNNNKLTFTFGITDSENIDGSYQDLNSVNFNVPGMLGGGYHYMQFDGKYKDTNNQDANFNYHVIRAVDTSDPTNLKFEDTSFTVDLGIIEIKNNTTIEISMNIAEWFTNPNTWDLNVLNTVLMPNFEAQKQMNANGKTVFRVGEINP
jgi:hypothetical protein